MFKCYKLQDLQGSSGVFMGRVHAMAGQHCLALHRENINLYVLAHQCTFVVTSVIWCNQCYVLHKLWCIFLTSA